MSRHAVHLTLCLVLCTPNPLRSTGMEPTLILRYTRTLVITTVQVYKMAIIRHLIGDVTNSTT